jgi:hypothetical protein
VGFRKDAGGVVKLQDGETENALDGGGTTW